MVAYLRLDVYVPFVLLSCLWGSVTPCNPPTGYTLYQNVYYKISAAPANHLSAKAACEADKAQLATFKTNAELESLKEIMINAGEMSLWLGLYHLRMVPCELNSDTLPDCQDDWFWTDGSLASEIHNNSLISSVFGSGPNACVRFGLNANLASTSCLDNHYFVCQYRCELENFNPHRCTNGDIVPPGFQPWEGKYYKLVTETKTFAESDTYCQSIGATLLSPRTENNYQLALFFTDYFKQQLHIGLKNPSLVTCLNEGCDGQLKWLDDSDFTFDPSFMLHDLSAASVSNCLATTNNFKLEPSDCSSKRPFVCVLDCDVVIDGSWGAWSSWSSCVAPATTKTRTRVCNEPAPFGGGLNCTGLASETEPCPSPTCSPPAGYHWSGNYFYKGVSSFRTFVQAKAICEDEGARLATFRTDLDFDAVKNEQNLIGSNDVWLGILHRGQTQCNNIDECIGRIYWDDGAPATELWGIKRLQDIEGTYLRPCIRLRADTDIIGDRPCFDNYKFICQYDCNNVFNGSLGLFCGDGHTPVPPFYTPWNGKHFRVFTTPMTFADAQATCREFGSVVSTFETTEAWFNTKFYAEMTLDPVYIGLSDPTGAVTCLNAGCTNQLVWSDGTPFTYDASITTEDIKVEPGKSCLIIDDSVKVVNEDCSMLHGFTCQLDCSSAVIVDGGWSDWGPHSVCDGLATFQYRNRTCNNPPPNHFGAECVGDAIEATPCSATWLDWSPWSSCSSTCGYGVKARTRICSHQEQCDGLDVSYDYCTPSPCPGQESGEIKFKKQGINDATKEYYKGNLTGVLDLSAFQDFNYQSFCATACVNIRTNQDDFSSCNSFIVDGSSCHFGFTSLQVVHNLTIEGPSYIFLDIDV